MPRTAACPLCGREFPCSGDAACWCAGEPVPRERAARIGALTAGCVCAGCLRSG